MNYKINDIMNDRIKNLFKFLIKFIMVSMILINITSCTTSGNQKNNNFEEFDDSDAADNSNDYYSTLKSGKDIRTERVGKLMGDLVVLDSNNKKGIFNKEQLDNALKVNPYVWKAAIERVSFIPIIMADTQTGIIITDWYKVSEDSAERYKLNITILGKKLTSNCVKIIVFKEILQNKKWIVVRPSTAIGHHMEIQIVDMAKKLMMAH